MVPIGGGSGRGRSLGCLHEEAVSMSYCVINGPTESKFKKSYHSRLLHCFRGVLKVNKIKIKSRSLEE